MSSLERQLRRNRMKRDKYVVHCNICGEDIQGKIEAWNHFAQWHPHILTEMAIKDGYNPFRKEEADAWLNRGETKQDPHGNAGSKG